MHDRPTHFNVIVLVHSLTEVINICSVPWRCVKSHETADPVYARK